MKSSISGYEMSYAFKNQVLNLGEAQKRCANYRKKILDISQQVSAIHAASAFSCTEIVDLIYNYLMSWKCDNVSDDTFLMSKGHGCLIQYLILEERGILRKRDIEEYCTARGRLGAHPDFGVPGVSAATGSLGHGMGIAVGMAYADKIQNKPGEIFLLLSDGECQEGSTWEGAMMAANLKLDRLTVFVDLNDFGGLERMSEGHIAFYPLIEKFMSFGWQVFESDGHDHMALAAAYESRNSDKPTAIVCNTVKGKGVSYMENVPIWHYRSPNNEEYLQAIKELAKE